MKLNITTSTQDNAHKYRYLEAQKATWALHYLLIIKPRLQSGNIFDVCLFHA